MSKEKVEYVIKRLDKPRPSFTAQGFNVVEEKDMPHFRFVQDKGDPHANGKRPGLAITGGGGEVIFDAIIGDSEHKDLREPDLAEFFKFRPVSLNGELITGKRGLSVLLRHYDFGSVLPLEVEEDNTKDNFLTITIKPTRDEKPDETIKREFLNETGIEIEIVPAEDGWAFYPSYDLRKPGVWRESEYDEILVEIGKDHFDRTIPHFLYIFHVKDIGEKVKPIREIAEISGIQKLALNNTLKKILTDDLSYEYADDRELNPEGFYFIHAVRFFHCCEVLGIDFVPHLPKSYNRELASSAFKLIRSFLPVEIQKGILNGIFYFNGEHEEKEPETNGQDSSSGVSSGPAGRDNSRDAWEKFLGEYAKPNTR